MSNRERSKPKGKKINPKFWVFCEGKTEDAYVGFLRTKYRLPIEIISKIIGSKIDERIIDKHKSNKTSHEKDQAFLLYDADVKEVLEQLKKITNATLLTSNPSLEYWFLLHYKNQSAEITTKKCIEELSKRNNNTYIKGQIDDKLKTHLNSYQQEACKRVKHTTPFNNPSSNVNIFIEELEKAKKQ